MKTLCLTAGLLACASLSAQQIPKGLTASNGQYIGFYEYKPTDYSADPTARYPLIIFLHGIGERGNGTTQLSRVLANAIPKYINAGHPMRFFWNGRWQTFLVLSPQLNDAMYGYWPTFYVDEMIKYAKANLRVDTNRIILTGLSLGGGGVWTYAVQSLANSQQFSAIGVSCGACESGDWCNVANANLPTWAFHAQDDATIGYGCTTATINAIATCNGGAPVQPYMTIWPTGGHGIWDRVFDTVYNWQNPNIYEWFLGQDRSLPVNRRPVANAGPNLTISATSGIANLSGALSTDADGHIVRYIWRKVSGPSAGTITSPVSANGLTRITGLTTAGTYQYELKAVDDRADYSLATVNVTVVAGPVSNIPPVTEPGTDQVVAVPITTLDGTNSYDPDGTISSYSWTQVAGPPAVISDNAAASPSVSGLLIGTYQFQLATTDNKGATTMGVVSVLSGGTALPVKLLYFKGQLSSHGTELVWATASEYKNAGFTIERSADGKSFSAIGSVPGADLSFNKKEYSFTDVQSPATVSYYRIKQVNADGKITYSSIISIVPGGADDRLEYFPNPALNSITIRLSNKEKGPMTIKLYGLDGKLVLQKQAIKQQQLGTGVLDLQHVLPGIYMLEVSVGDGLRMMRKVVKQ